MIRSQLFIKPLLLLGMLLSVSVHGFAKEKTEGLILNRIYAYQKALNPMIDSLQDNIYAKIHFNVEKRNFILKFIPTMHSLSKDPRKYIRESYAKVLFQDSHHFDINSQVLSSTIPKDHRVLSPLLNFMTPNIYDVALYEGHMLSPFNRHNRHFYRFTQKQLNDSTTWLEFKPKFYNTQLLNGYALVETSTGRVIMAMLNGEFDMISFRTHIEQGDEGARSLMPKRCSMVGSFRFMGNHISALFDASYNCPITLPDSITKVSSRKLMDSIRPIPLSEADKEIYDEYNKRIRQDSINRQQEDSTATNKQLLKKIIWDTIGDNLVTPISAESEDSYFKLSPIINPLYLSYSGNRGWRYKMKLRTRYTFSPHRYLTLNPTFGYNFKQRQFYFTAPLRMTYNPKRNGYTEIVWGNGNPISNSCVTEKIKELYPDSIINFDNTNMHKFKDTYLKVFNNIMLFNWFDIEAGLIYHVRSALDKQMMLTYGMPIHYKSFAPMIGLKFQPWLNNGPTLSIDYERAIKGVMNSDLEYERWEFDAQWKKKIPGLRVLNLRAGGGFFTKSGNYFVDYVNFRDENLPGGWDDNWSGDVQLLRSREYNRSDYYIRSNVSYETPMMFATWIPYLGKYIEKERFYLSNVLLEHSRPYYELGYGFTNRYISVGAFASFRNTTFDRAGVEVEIELFRRW